MTHWISFSFFLVVIVMVITINTTAIIIIIYSSSCSDELWVYSDTQLFVNMYLKSKLKHCCYLTVTVKLLLLVIY